MISPAISKPWDISQNLRSLRTQAIISWDPHRSRWIGTEPTGTPTTGRTTDFEKELLEGLPGMCYFLIICCTMLTTKFTGHVACTFPWVAFVLHNANWNLLSRNLSQHGLRRQSSHVTGGPHLLRGFIYLHLNFGWCSTTVATRSSAFANATILQHFLCSENFNLPISSIWNCKGKFGSETELFQLLGMHIFLTNLWQFVWNSVHVEVCGRLQNIIHKKARLLSTWPKVSACENPKHQNLGDRWGRSK